MDYLTAKLVKFVKLDGENKKHLTSNLIKVFLEHFNAVVDQFV